MMQLPEQLSHKMSLTTVHWKELTLNCDLSSLLKPFNLFSLSNSIFFCQMFLLIYDTCNELLQAIFINESQQP